MVMVLAVAGGHLVMEAMVAMVDMVAMEAGVTDPMAMATVAGVVAGAVIVILAIIVGDGAANFVNHSNAKTWGNVIKWIDSTSKQIELVSNQ